MKIKDWELLSLVSGGIAFIGLISTASFAVFGQVLASCFILGFIILLIRRGIIKAKNKIMDYKNEEKKQAV